MGVIGMIAFRLEGWPAVIFILASVMIDADHIVEIFRGVHNLKRKYIWDVKGFKKANYDGVQRSLHVFHTFEVIIAFFIVGKYYWPFFYIASSFSLHFLTDAWGNFWNRNVHKKGGSDWIKYYFLIYYIKKGSIFNVKK